jgi:DNA-binding NarL/FixJ family response regulator
MTGQVSLPNREPRYPNPVMKALLSPVNPAEGLLSAADWVKIGETLRLTPRELSIAAQMFDGKTRPQISRNLKCALGTVRVYIDRVFQKLNVRDRLGLVLRLVRIHWMLMTAR